MGRAPGQEDSTERESGGTTFSSGLPTHPPLGNSRANEILCVLPTTLINKEKHLNKEDKVVPKNYLKIKTLPMQRTHLGVSKDGIY